MLRAAEGLYKIDSSPKGECQCSNCARSGEQALPYNVEPVSRDFILDQTILNASQISTLFPHGIREGKVLVNGHPALFSDAH